MSLYVLDTDTLTLLRTAHPAVRQRATSHSPNELAIAVMTVEEQLSGWYRLLRRVKRVDELARAYHELAESVRFLSGWRILTFPVAAIQRYDQLAALKLNVRKWTCVSPPSRWRAGPSW